MYVYYQVKHRLQIPTLGRKFDITQWFSCGAEGLAYGRMITKNFSGGQITKFLKYVASLARGAPLITRVRKHTSAYNALLCKYISCFKCNRNMKISYVSYPSIYTTVQSFLDKPLVAVTSVKVANQLIAIFLCIRNVRSLYCFPLL